MLIQKDKKKFIRVALVFAIWLVLMFVIGFSISDEQNKKEAPVEMEETVDLTGEDVPEEEKTPEQKEAAEKRRKLNEITTTGDLDSLANSLKITKDWDLIGEVKENGIPVLRPYFPKGQNREKWRESLVFRDFVNVKIKNPANPTYTIYSEWLKSVLPDVQMTKTEDNTGVAFFAKSESGKVYVTGKVFEGKLESTVYIVQYVLKDNGSEDSLARAKNWQDVLGAIH